MKTSFYLAGALALVLAPASWLLPGCGGGGSGGGSSVSDTTFGRQSNVEFPDDQQITGVLSVSFSDSAASTVKATGTLQLYQTPANAPTPLPLAPGQVPTGDYQTVVPANATYVLVGTVRRNANSASDLTLDLRGSFEDEPPFTLRGDFVNGAILTLEADFKSGKSVLVGRVTNVNRVNLPAPTATPVATSTPVATPAATVTPSITATPIFTPIPTATPIFTPTAIPTATPTAPVGNPPVVP